MIHKIVTVMGVVNRGESCAKGVACPPTVNRFIGI